jgi:hypothetical protein
MIPILSAVEREGFSIVPVRGPDGITIKLSGSCDSQTTSLLDGFLSGLHAEVVRGGSKTVILDCENLYFMNSASVKSFVIWLTKIKALPPLERYQVNVRTNRFLAWQQRSFNALGRSAPEVLTVLP